MEHGNRQEISVDFKLVPLWIVNISPDLMDGPGVYILRGSQDQPLKIFDDYVPQVLLYLNGGINRRELQVYTIGPGQYVSVRNRKNPLPEK